MEYELTNAGQALVETDGNSKLDAACKALLADKQILARILKECAVEYKDCTIEEIIDCIEQPSVGSSPLDRAGKPLPQTDKIQGISTEDTTLYEGMVKYDILFRAQLPKQRGITELIVNVEAQNDFHPGYSLVTRGIYYTSRLISAQKNVQFEGSNYQGIAKVYSVWVCIDPTEAWRDTITLYRLCEENLVGNAHEKPEAYDKMRIAVVGLGNQKPSEGNPLLGMLEVLLNSEMPAAEKMYELQKYGVQSTKQLEGGVTTMCNYSKGVLQKGIEKGIEQGIEKGIEQGIEKGLEEGALALIDTLVEIGFEPSAICQKLMEKLNLTSETAEEYWNLYQQKKNNA